MRMHPGARRRSNPDTIPKPKPNQDPRPCGCIQVRDGGDAAAAEDSGGTDDKGFQCVACNKWYKNASQLSNHEKSGKHKAMVAKLKKQLTEDVQKKPVGAEDVDLRELEEMALEDGEADEERSEGARDADEGGARGGGGGKAKKKKKKKGRGGGLDEDSGADDDVDDDGDAEIMQAVASTALPSPGLVALQSRQAFESTDEYKKLNKTQRRKALLQWEAEHEHLVAALRAEGGEPKEAAPKEKKPEREAPAKKEKDLKVHGSGAHSREIKTPKKKKAVYLGGGSQKVVEVS